jgi:NADPH-dependent curcumin reductase CurA
MRCRNEDDRTICELETQQKIIIRDIYTDDIDRLRLFNCGNRSMNSYIHREALLNHVLGEGITRVVLDENEEFIIGYFTLKCTSIKFCDPDMGEKREIPCVEISRLAVCISWQNGTNGFHLGTSLVGYIIATIKEDIASRVGCRWITIHAVQGKVNWYREQFNFDYIIDDTPDEYGTVSMFLDISDMEKYRTICSQLSS